MLTISRYFEVLQVIQHKFLAPNFSFLLKVRSKNIFSAEKFGTLLSSEKPEKLIRTFFVPSNIIPGNIVPRATIVTYSGRKKALMQLDLNIWDNGKMEYNGSREYSAVRVHSTVRAETEASGYKNSLGSTDMK